MIRLNGISKSFGKTQVLSDLDVFFEGGKITAVLGPNGSGKTTLMKSILGMVIPEKGTIKVRGRNILRDCKYRSDIGYLPQIARFPENLTVNELIAMISRIRGAEGKSEEFISYFDLHDFLNTKMGHLSGGTRQKVNIVLAFMFDTPMLLLDEPTAGLDPLSLLRLKQLLEREKKNGKSILITSHIMSFVEEMADDVIFLMDGKVHFRGHPEEIKKQKQSDSLEKAIAHVLRDARITYSQNGKSDAALTESFQNIKS